MFYINDSNPLFIAHTNCSLPELKVGDLTCTPADCKLSDLVKRIVSHPFLPTACCPNALEQTLDLVKRRDTPQGSKAAERVFAALKLRKWVNAHQESDKESAMKVYSTTAYQFDWRFGIALPSLTAPVSFPFEILEKQNRLVLSGLDWIGKRDTIRTGWNHHVLSLEGLEWFFEGFPRLTRITKLIVNTFNVAKEALPIPVVEAVVSLPFLRELSLVGLTRLREIPTELTKLINLHSLTLRHNGLEVISNIPPLHTLIVDELNVLSFSTQLQVVSLDWTLNFKNWPKNSDFLTSVVALKIEKKGYRIGELPRAFECAQKLKTLHLINCPTLSLTSLRALTNLDHLRVSLPLPSGIEWLTQLKELVIDGDECTPFIESSLTSLCSLKHLFIWSANIQVPPFISALTNLVVLKVEHNDERILPSEIVNLTTLSPLCRQFVLNSSAPSPELSEKWLKAPYQAAPWDSLDLNLNSFYKFRLPGTIEYREPETRTRIVEELTSVGSLSLYEIEKGNFLEEGFRTNVNITLPAKLYFEFFMAYLWAYAISEKDGMEFEGHAVQAVYDLLQKLSPQFQADITLYGDTFNRAFKRGKIWDLETGREAAPILNIKSAWLPEDEQGKNPIPDRKIDRARKMHLHALCNKGYK